MRQYTGEDLDGYVKTFHGKALDYYYLMTEDVLVDVRLYLIEDYKVFLENCLFLPFLGWRRLRAKKLN